MPSYLITGSSRGIGLALVTELLKDSGNVVLATARNPAASKGLQELASKYPSRQLVLMQLDTTVPEQISNAAKEAARLLPDGLDYLINNAAINEQALTPFDELNVEQFSEEVKFHTAPIIHILREFKPLVAKSREKKVVFISSIGASLTNAPLNAAITYPYSVGKAAQNMIARKWGTVNKEQGIITVLIHPGWVDTDMGGIVNDFSDFNAPDVKPLTPAESAAGILKVAHEAKLEDAVSFLWYDGRVLEW
ncbi:NAD(P)-binding protein [Panus rudis PR-1116 ss-1]|nr:NAD(P)-binding protein [Panus rudis PR-1116 ss-1]